MSTLLLEADNIVKQFGDKVILDVNSFKIYSGDRIGFVGLNGVGKTTLLDILFGEIEPDSGNIRRYCDIGYIRQFEQIKIEERSAGKLGEYGVLDKVHNSELSGGEITRIKIANVLSGNYRLLFADEPTSSVDMYGVDMFGLEMSRYDSFLLVSHNRDLLNRYCNRIISIENCAIASYEGNYDAYKSQVLAKQERKILEHQLFVREKERLHKVLAEKKATAKKVTKSPKGMTSKEIRARKFESNMGGRSFQAKQKNINQSAKAIESRISQLEEKQPHIEPPIMKFEFSIDDPPRGKIVLHSSEVNFAYGDHVLFDRAKLEVCNGAKVALCGENGSGKSTLLNIIFARQVKLAPKLTIGYFRQDFEQLDMGKSVLQNALRDSNRSESSARSILAQLLFTRDTIYKQAGALSGGERIKLGLAKLLLSGCNMLLLDEPTNYLDIPSLEALQKILLAYEGTLMFVSHDRAFVNSVSSAILLIKDKKIVQVDKI